MAPSQFKIARATCLVFQSEPLTFQLPGFPASGPWLRGLFFRKIGVGILTLPFLTVTKGRTLTLSFLTPAMGLGSQTSGAGVGIKGRRQDVPRMSGPKMFLKEVGSDFWGCGPGPD